MSENRAELSGSVIEALKIPQIIQET
jgi:hypothetical protein